MIGSKACVTLAKANRKPQRSFTRSCDGMSNRFLPDKATSREPDGVAVSAALNQADDKTGSFETTKQREVTRAALLFTSKHPSKRVILLLCQKKK